VRSAHPAQPHRFALDRYESTSHLTDEPVLLIDDTWTTGANAQSAAAALKRAGAGPVAAVVIGRHLNRRWGSNDIQLKGLPKAFDWEHCVRC
jgi:adenine/guanine phosphoribosyltransferase-like PRPP-binding protein